MKIMLSTVYLFMQISFLWIIWYVLSAFIFAEYHFFSIGLSWYTFLTSNCFHKSNEYIPGQPYIRDWKSIYIRLYSNRRLYTELTARLTKTEKVWYFGLCAGGKTTSHFRFPPRSVVLKRHFYCPLFFLTRSLMNS